MNGLSSGATCRKYRKGRQPHQNSEVDNFPTPVRFFRAAVFFSIGKSPRLIVEFSANTRK